MTYSASERQRPSHTPLNASDEYPRPELKASPPSSSSNDPQLLGQDQSLDWTEAGCNSYTQSANAPYFLPPSPTPASQLDREEDSKAFTRNASLLPNRYSSGPVHGVAHESNSPSLSASASEPGWAPQQEQDGDLSSAMAACTTWPKLGPGVGPMEQERPPTPDRSPLTSPSYQGGFTTSLFSPISPSTSIASAAGSMNHGTMPCFRTPERAMALSTTSTLPMATGARFDLHDPADPGMVPALKHSQHLRTPIAARTCAPALLFSTWNRPEGFVEELMKPEARWSVAPFEGLPTPITPSNPSIMLDRLPEGQMPMNLESTLTPRRDEASLGFSSSAYLKPCGPGFCPHSPTSDPGREWGSPSASGPSSPVPVDYCVRSGAHSAPPTVQVFVPSAPVFPSFQEEPLAVADLNLLQHQQPQQYQDFATDRRFSVLDPRPRYACPFPAHCGDKTFVSLWNLQEHMKTHSTERIKPHRCEVDGCGRAYFYRRDLVRHQRKVHEAAERGAGQGEASELNIEAMPRDATEPFLHAPGFPPSGAAETVANTFPSVFDRPSGEQQHFF